MRRSAWVPLMMSLGLTAGCTPGALTPNTINQINSLLGEYGFSLKTVDPTTGKAVSLSQSDVDSVFDDQGNKVDAKFDTSGKLVFRPTKEGQQTIKVKMKDGSFRTFQVNGQKGAAHQDADVAFIPDSSGQGFSSSVAVGATIDPAAQFSQQETAIAAKRVKVTFGGAALDGLTAASVKAVYFDRQRLPQPAYGVDANGALMLDPNLFFLVQGYKLNNSGALPPIRVAYLKGGTLTIVFATLSNIPSLPTFTPPQPGSPPPPPPTPDQFAAGQVIDCSISGTDTATDLGAYESANGFQINVPQPGQFGPPPLPPNQDPFRKKALQFAVNVPLNLPSGATAANIKSYWIGRFPRPVMDVINVASGSVVLDPMVMFQVRMYQTTLLNDPTLFPWVRIVYSDSTGMTVYKFRIHSPAPGWWGTFASKFTPGVPQGFQPPATISVPIPGQGGGGACQSGPAVAPPPFIPPTPDVLGAPPTLTVGTDIDVATESVPNNDPNALGQTLNASNNP